MTKLISGRVHKVPSANVSADRYQFIELSETEPDLGLPSELGQVFTSDLSGNRYWVRLDTANVSETTNQYFTNVRVLQAVDPKLTTANVLESANSLYYTNNRVFSFVTGMSIGDLVDVANIYTYPTSNSIIGIQQGQALVWNGNIFIPVFVNSEVANVADLAVKVLNLENQSTANVREAASNLYFTNTRVLDAISLATINPNNVNANNIVTNSITANIWNRLYTANVIETADNLYFTNARTVGVVTPLLTTANVIEASSNLYFTTQRARDSVSNSTGVYYNTVTGVFSIGQDVAITSDVQFRDLILSGNLFILGNVAIVAANTLKINDPLIQIGVGNPGDQWDLGIVGHYLDNGERHAGIFRDATDGKFKFFSNTLIEPGNVNYIDTTESAFRLASVVAATFEGNVFGTVTSLANHTTSNLAEGTNLYFTNARVVQTVTPLLTTANVLELSNQYFTNVRVLQAVDPKLTTANVNELNNLYFTNARVLSNVEQMSINVLADVDITGVSVNATLVWDGTKFIPGSTDIALRSNFANTATFANVSGVSNVALLTDRANVVSSLSNHNTSNLAEGTNLYFTNARTIGVVTPLLTTANVTEVTSNLYFTLERARTAYSAGLGIAISANGVISSKGDDTGLGVFNAGVNLANALILSNNFANLVTFDTNDGLKHIVYSLHLTNFSNQTAYVTGRYVSGANTILFSNLFEMPAASFVEYQIKPQIYYPGDQLQFRSFSNPDQPANNLVSALVSYQGSVDTNFIRVANVINHNIIANIYTSTSRTTLFEGIKVVNPNPTAIPVSVWIADNNYNLFAYLAANVTVPAFSSIELCDYPKALKDDFTIRASKNSAVSTTPLSFFLSGKYTTQYSITPSTTTINEGDTVTFDLSTLNVRNGTVLYYTIKSYSGSLAANDFVTSSNGTVTVSSDAALINITANADAFAYTESDETFSLEIRKGSITGTVLVESDIITIKNTSNTQTANASISTINPAYPTLIAPGSNVVFSIQTTNL